MAEYIYNKWASSINLYCAPLVAQLIVLLFLPY